jgi:phenylacetate-coenzyme A ligase PaaK-like adenylate-forming protein
MPRKKQEEPDFRFTIKHTKDNPDGSCDVQIDMSDYVRERLVEVGVIALLKQHINQTYKELPWYKRLFKRRKIELS